MFQILVVEDDRELNRTVCTFLNSSGYWAVSSYIVFFLLVAYPVYNAVLKKDRERIAPEILRLTDELMK